MTDYKLVPVEPTAEMVKAACDEEQRPLPMWTRMKAIYKAMLAAAPDHIAGARKMVAPAVQGEPVALPPFATKIIEKLRRFDVCAEDGQGVDIGRHWLDTLVQLGLLNRVQRSPALWEMAQQGEDVLEGYAAPQPTSPDVSALVEALEDIAGTHHHSASAGAYFAKVARAALAAHRTALAQGQGEE